MEQSPIRSTPSAGPGVSPNRPHPDPSSPPTRLSVLWLVKGLGPGGAERLLVSAAQAADHQRFRIHTAFVDPGKTHLVPALRDAGVQVHGLATGGGSPWGWVPRLRSLLLDGRYDVLHLHSPLLAGIARAVVRTLPAHRRPRLVSTEHNVWSAFSTPTRVLNALTWGLDHAHLAVSDEVRLSVRPRRRIRHVEVVVHGIDLRTLDHARTLRERAREELGVGTAEILVGTVANFRSHKAYPDLLDAAAHVVGRDPRVRFVAVGQGPLRDEIEAHHRRLGLGERFRLHGYDPDPLRILAACDVFVLSSHFEGYPVALMEALGMGLPVVATSVGGIPEAVRDGREGILVPPRRPDLLAAALLRVVGDDALRAHLATAALERGDHFDIHRAVERMQEVYLELAGAARR